MIDEKAQSQEAWSSIALAYADQGFAIFNQYLRLVFFNQRFIDLYRLPPNLVFNGAGFEDLARYVAERDSPDNVEPVTEERVQRAKEPVYRRREQGLDDGTVLDMRTTPLPDGGFVTTYTDITTLKEAIKQAEDANQAKLISLPVRAMNCGLR